MSHEDEAREILESLAPLLFEHLAAAEWGRLLVPVDPAPEGEHFVIRDLHIEDVIGDEARIEEALRSRGAVSMIPVLAGACEALCALGDVSLADVDGGTFVRLDDQRFAFLPGLVRTPSEGFEALCRERVGPVMARQQALAEQHQIRDEFEVDLASATITFLEQQRPVARAGTLLLGSFSEQTRTWAWAWGNESLPDELRAPSRDLCDNFARRDLWELTTPQFTSDLNTAWELSALLAHEAGADGVYRIPQGHRHVFLLLRDLRAIPR